MSFDGVIESFSAGQISGWISHTTAPEAGSERLSVQLRFHRLGTFNPTHVAPRSERATGFIFKLPPSFLQMPWQAFLDEYDGVFASHTSNPADRWRVPFFKSVLGAFDPNNRTVVVAERRREYSFGPKPEGRMAALTIVYNEHQILPLWAKYYASVVGAENVFVLDQGSDQPYTDLPEGVTVIRLPRENFDNWLIMRLVATFQRHLLESYDAVLYADSDEFLCVAPDVLKGESLKSFLLDLPDPVGITTGYNLHHDILREGALDPARPVLEQRKYLTRERSMDKPMISRIPLNWIPGFHTAREGGTIVPGMFMLHLRLYDLDAALLKGGRYRTSKWDPYDVEKGLASYQRDSEDDIVNQFRRRAEVFGQITATEFDISAATTVIPEWMRHALWV